MDTLGIERSRLKLLRSQIDDALEELLPDLGDPPHRLHAAMRHALLSPGKRIRPILALLAAEHLGCPAAVAMPGACALEMVHAASLVLDDLPCMDDAATRRGQPAVHVRFGQDVAVLAGVALLNEAFGVIARAATIGDGARLRMVSLLTRTVGLAGLVGGQAQDLDAAAAHDLGFLNGLHHAKTGVLFIAAVEMGALAAGADDATLEALRAFARELGLAFQALDDLEDAAEIALPRPAANLLRVMGADNVRQEAAERLASAKLALSRGGPALAPIGGYVDLLMGRVGAAVP
jgi:geranylgeranyl diphosphate synthase type II